MSQSIETRVDRVRDAARRRTLAIGAVRGATLVLSVWLVLGGIDSLARWSDPGLRWISSLAAWGAVVAATVRWTRWRERARALDSLHVARRLERSFPQLRDRLASAYEFATRPAAGGGSSDLRRAAIREASELAGELDFAAAFDRERWRRELWPVALVLVLLGLAAARSPVIVARGAERLAAPWREAPWPRRNHLEWIGFPHRAARGAEVTLQLRDRDGRSPESVELWLRSADGAGEPAERVVMRRVDERFVHRFERLEQSLLVRAAGGDDASMPWQLIEVDEPPRIERLEATLIPPEYAGRPRERAGQPLRALAGTRVALEGRATKALSRVVVRSADEGAGRGDDAPVAVGVPAEDGLDFSFPLEAMSAWTIQRSGVFVLELVDQAGLIGEGARYVVQIVPDDPPAITWESPEAESVLTSAGETAIVATVRDDLAVRRVTLRRRATTPDRKREGEGEPPFAETTLYAGSERPAPPGETMGESPDESRTIRATWKPADDEIQEPGTQIDLWLVAEDYKGQVVETAPRRVLVISPSDFEDRIGQREAALLHVLTEAERTARETQQQIGALAGALSAAGRLEPRRLDLLQAAELQLRQVTRTLGADRDGARGMIAALLDELRRNHVRNESLESRLAVARRTLESLERDHWERAAPALVAVRKNAPSGDAATRWPNAEEEQRRLEEAEGHVDAGRRALEELLGRLAPWDDLRRTIREFARLVRDQEETRRRTAELLRAAADEGERAGAERARLAERQFELERRFERLVERWERWRAEGTDATRESGIWKRVVEEARNSAAGEAMRDAARQLAENRLGRALTRVDDALSELQRLADLLSGRRGDVEGPSSLPRAEQEILRVLARQRGIRDEVEGIEKRRGAAGKLDGKELARTTELAAEERALADETNRLAEETRNDDEGVSFALSGAARQTERVAQRLIDASGGLEPALEALDALLRRLEALAEALRAERPPREPPPESEPREKPDDGAAASARVRQISELRLLQSLQRELSRRTAELEASRRRRGGMAPELAAELKEIADEQGRLADLLGRLLDGPGGDQ